MNYGSPTFWMSVVTDDGDHARARAVKVLCACACAGLCAV